ncbi:MAG: DNA polymerase III subunit alpha [Bacteroidia bacterium]|nr:DNA polymerase III subunit alpha [Bacteroidia bacterium]MCX7652848.1 DNA polymerase III subunit alpha [Bacteroidia bacterium]MDW8417596.1 DNA polymerase III subunit alpha [Bacteroidia bacterium]
MCDFVHLHVHTEYSLLDGASRVEDLIRRAKSLGMSAIALSDHGNLFAVPKFYAEAEKAGLKPIIGCEFYIVDGESFTKDKSYYHLLLLAKDQKGWENLLYLSSVSFIEGFYYKPRIHRGLLENYREGLIATTGCLASEINQKILAGQIQAAEKRFQWYLELFGEDFYVELQDHGLKDQHLTAEYLLEWAKKYGVKILGTNDIHYTCEADADLHDLLLAIQTGSDMDDKKRLRFTDDLGNLNRHFYLKSQAEMMQMPIFREHPEALTQTREVAEKCNLTLNFKQPLILPRYPTPPTYPSMEAYLRDLCYEGAKGKYGDPLPPSVVERLEHELKIIAQMGFSGYFLIVQDFIAEAKRRGVWVGPGRGSAAGSLVAYCLGITSIDPLAYQLLFERFLNPERISPPDIDIDFDDLGREEVIRYVQEKYGQESVAQIITYGTMGIKTAIRDVGRVLKVSLSEVNEIVALIPNKPNITWQTALDPEENPKAYLLHDILNKGPANLKRMLESAAQLEGLTRHTGVHAAGVIIAPDKLWKYVPLAVATREEAARQVITQWDGPDCESVGLLKMDFLGLKTLSILKTAVELIQKLEKADAPIDLEKIPLDDEKTWKLFQEGNTVGIFQFESEGMQKYLRMLRPTCIEDLIAMNALYRPGPMDNIPTFVRRKHGEEPVSYPDPRLRPILENTYGIMVYQEQIMQIAQVMAGYSLAEADLLRRAMGKKKKEIMDEQRAVFISRAIAHNTDPQVAEEVFDTMARFAEYGFNKSHAAAYSILAYRTGFLKANYPAAYMAAVLTHHADDTEKTGFFLQEVRNLGIEVLPPCVNASEVSFSVPSPNEIRFGLGAIKHLGEKLAQLIIEERRQNGPFKDVFDFAVRMLPHGLNKRSLESLAFAGALDILIEGQREYLLEEANRQLIMDYAASYHKATQTTQLSLFDRIEIGPLPKPRFHNPQRRLALPEKLRQEREYIGFFLSSHPLDEYAPLMRSANIITNASDIINQELPSERLIRSAALLMDIDERRSKQGKPYARLSFEDKVGSFMLTVFSPQWETWANQLRGHIGDPYFIEAEYLLRANGSGEWRTKQIAPLPDALYNSLPALYLIWEVSNLNEDTLADVVNLMESWKGTTPVSFVLFHHKTAVLMETAWRLKYSPEMVEAFDSIKIKVRTKSPLDKNHSNFVVATYATTRAN